jgi:methylphosphotriester-DNA--protein-cysteine methyltransferase
MAARSFLQSVHRASHDARPGYNTRSVPANSSTTSTPRFIQRLFKAEGTTFIEYVLAQRLARAHRALIDPRRDILNLAQKTMAPRAGIEPATFRLTVERSTAELPRNRPVDRQRAYNKAQLLCKG